MLEMQFKQFLQQGGVTSQLSTNYNLVRNRDTYDLKSYMCSLVNQTICCFKHVNQQQQQHLLQVFPVKSYMCFLQANYATSQNPLMSALLALTACMHSNNRHKSWEKEVYTSSIFEVEFLLTVVGRPTFSRAASTSTLVHMCWSDLRNILRFPLNAELTQFHYSYNTYQLHNNNYNNNNDSTRVFAPLVRGWTY